MPDREDALKLQVRILADRLAIAVAMLKDGEAEMFFSYGKEAANAAADQRFLLLSDLTTFEQDRNEYREKNAVFYKQAMDDVKGMLRGALRAARET